MTRAIAFGSLVLLGALGSASAADLPVKARPLAPVAASGGFYVWADGSYQRVNLPTYNLGPSIFAGTGLAATYGSQAVAVDPRLDGFGISGGVGYVLPPGTLAAFGSNFRIELGGSFVRATGTSNGAATYGPSATGALYQPLSGVLAVTFACAPCNTSSSVATTYESWQVKLKAASDIRSGTFTWTPSLALFAGTSTNNQSLNQLTNNGFTPTNLIYVANTQERWTDWGARAGLDGTVDVSPALAFGLGGSVAVAARRTTLSGNDLLNFGSTFINAGAVSTGADRTAFLANAEARLLYRVMPNVALKAFAGLNYDNSVPAIVAPSFVGPFGFFTAPTNAASIGYQALTSYYAGGGVTVRF